MDIHCRYVMNTRRGINTYTCICVDDIYLRDVIFHFFYVGPLKNDNILENSKFLTKSIDVLNAKKYLYKQPFFVDTLIIHSIIFDAFRYFSFQSWSIK